MISHKITSGLPEFARAEIAGWSGHPILSDRSQWHNEVELNLVERGAVTYLFGGESRTLTPGRLVVFWGTRPHRIIHHELDALLDWLTVPLARFLQWNLPRPFAADLLGGRIIVHEEIEEPSSIAALLHRCYDCLDKNDTEWTKVAGLEVEVLLRRAALVYGSGIQQKRSQSSVGLPAAAEMSKVERMAQFIAEHYSEPVEIANIARAADLHPHYAVALFRKACGMGLLDYLTQHRLAHAQHLLVTTDSTILHIALESGFGSLSRFYAVFTHVCGQTPKNYRRTFTH